MHEWFDAVVEGSGLSSVGNNFKQQTTAVIAANPDLDGYLCVDGAAPIGILAAIVEVGKKGDITFVGAENIAQILQYIKNGTGVL